MMELQLGRYCGTKPLCLGLITGTGVTDWGSDRSSGVAVIETFESEVDTDTLDFMRFVAAYTFPAILDRLRILTS